MAEGRTPEGGAEGKGGAPAGRLGKVERLGTERIGKLLLELSAQTTFSLLVYAVYSITDTYFLSVGVNSLAAAGASIISPVLIAPGGVAVMVAAYFQSMGKAKGALLLTLGGMLLIKLPVLLLGARHFGLDGIWAAEAVSELILWAVALVMLRYTEARAVLVPAGTTP